MNFALPRSHRGSIESLQQSTNKLTTNFQFVPLEYNSALSKLHPTNSYFRFSRSERKRDKRDIYLPLSVSFTLPIKIHNNVGSPPCETQQPWNACACRTCENFRHQEKDDKAIFAISDTPAAKGVGRELRVSSLSQK